MVVDIQWIHDEIPLCVLMMYWRVLVLKMNEFWKENGISVKSNKMLAERADVVYNAFL